MPYGNHSKLSETMFPAKTESRRRRDTDIKLDGKNRMELNGNDRGSYKHRPSEQKQRHPNQHQFATDMNRIMLYSRLKFKPQSRLRKYLSRKTGVRKSCYFIAEIIEQTLVVLITVQSALIQEELGSQQMINKSFWNFKCIQSNLFHVGQWSQTLQ